MEQISSRQMRMMQKLEYNLYFHQLIHDLHGEEATFDVLFNLRKLLREKGIASLSLYWNDLLKFKIENPDIKLSRIPIGGAHTSDTVDSNGEHHHLIYVYPETSVRDVRRAFKCIQDKFPTKEKVQPLGDQNEEVYDIIFKELLAGKKAAEIFDIFNDDESIEYPVERKTIDSIIKKMKKGL
ncbi:MAG: hypothetical protein PHU86_02090 [Patescibacteria group bacterium]|nr:hypothetical protein [Patescibacteria group bacterium]